VLVVKHYENTLVYLGTVSNITGEETNDFELFSCNEHIHRPTKVNLSKIDLQLIYETYQNKSVQSIVDKCVGTDTECEITPDTSTEDYQIDNVITEAREKRYDNYVSKYFNPSKRGIILKFTDHRMFKIDFNEFDYMQRIRGNEPLIRNRYLELLNDEHALKILVTYYYEHHFTFAMIRHNIMVVCNDIFLLYRNTHIKQLTKIDESHLYFRTLKQLHGQYKRTNIPITRADVYNKLKTYNVFLLKKLLRWTSDPRDGK
jgi:hypothetical protein